MKRSILEPSFQLTKQEKANLVVTRRVEAIRNGLQEPCLEPIDFAQLLKTGKTGETHTENEDASLRRLCRGYSVEGMHDMAIWVRFVTRIYSVYLMRIHFPQQTTVLGTHFIPRKNYKALHQQAQSHRLKPLGSRLSSRHRVSGLLALYILLTIIDLHR